MGRVSTWQAMELPCSPIYLINNMSTTSLETKTVLNTRNLCSFKPHQENITTLEDENREDQTLELFPLGSNHRNGINVSNKDTQVPIRAINTTFTPNQYFEFLPLKNWRRRQLSMWLEMQQLNTSLLFKSRWLSCISLFFCRKLVTVSSVSVMHGATVR